MALATTLKLNNGFLIPALGLGTGQLKEENIKYAIDVGYRHFDTAFAYKNEDQVGNAVRAKISEGVVKREDVFVTSKLWNTHHDPKKVEHACRKSLENLGLDYIDLYLMHWPRGFQYIDDDQQFPTDSNGKFLFSDVDYVDTWKAMEPLVEKGLVRSIGVSNFTIPQLERLLQNAEIKPVNNQVQCNPAMNQKELIAFCKQHGITVTAWSPLGRPNFDEQNASPSKSNISSTALRNALAKKTADYHLDEKTVAIAKKYNKTTPQVVLRYLIQNGVIPIPSSSKKERIIENINVFDFKLSEQDLKILDSFHQTNVLAPGYIQMQQI